MTLTPEDIERIKAEEMERQRIRAELEAQESKTAQAMKRSEIDEAWAQVDPRYKATFTPCTACKKPIRKSLMESTGCGVYLTIFIVGCFFWPLWIAIPILMVRKTEYQCSWCKQTFKA